MKAEIVIIGAGAAGLMSARELVESDTKKLKRRFDHPF